MIASMRAMPVYWSRDETVTADARCLVLALDRSVHDCMDLALTRRIDVVVVTAAPFGLPMRWRQPTTPKRS